MLEFNQVWLTGYLTSDPKIQNEGDEGNEKVWFRIRTARIPVKALRDGTSVSEEIERISALAEEDEEAAFEALEFDNIMIYYDGTDLMKSIKRLRKHDIVFVKGAYNVHQIQIRTECEHCNNASVYPMPLNAVYPIDILKLNSARGAYGEAVDDDPKPKRILVRQYLAMSNSSTLLQATVVDTPRMVPSKKYGNVCVLRLGVNRQYYIKTQDDTLADYPLVYAYYDEAEWAFKHLKNKAGIYYLCSIHPKSYNKKVACPICGQPTKVKMEQYRFIPIKRIHAVNYETDEVIALKEQNEQIMKALGEN